MKTTPLRTVYMEDLQSAIVAALDSLRNSGIIHDSSATDHLFDHLENSLEEYFDYPDYHNYN